MIDSYIINYAKRSGKENNKIKISCKMIFKENTAGTLSKLVSVSCKIIKEMTC